MTDYIQSPNMNLILPIPGVAPGPNYAFEQNTSFSLIDTHDHSPGKGVQVNPSGLNINSDLTYLNNNATNLRSVRFTPQISPLVLTSDIGCLYESGVDLYYNDGFGDVIRITQSGGVAGTPGSISGLVPPASASYVALSETFVFQSDVNTPANIDVASVILRNLVANSNGLTLNPPNAMAANYTITLPSLPSTLSIMTMDTSGNMFASTTVDNSTIVFVGGVLEVPAGGITSTQLATNSVITSKIADANVTRAKLIPVGRQISTSSGAYTSNATSPTAVTNLSVTITTTGGPVFVALQSDGTSNVTYIGTKNGPSDNSFYSFYRDGSPIATYSDYDSFTNQTNQESRYPGLPFFMDTPSAGTYTYQFYVSISSNAGGAITNVQYCTLLAYELY